MKKIAFVGNCQMLAVHNAFRSSLVDEAACLTLHIDSSKPFSEENKSFIADAEILVEQVLDFQPAHSGGALATTDQRISIPVVNLGFLWPFAGQPHPRAVAIPELFPLGAYPAELSDSYLNRMITKNIEVEKAVADYLALDVNKLVNLDRLKEISLEKQGIRDQKTGFQVAAVIEAHLRTEQLFLTPYHPNLRVSTYLISEALLRLGVPKERIDRAIEHLGGQTPFPKDALPIHPAVARHFGLEYVNDNKRYSYFQEGTFTQVEFVRRYLAYEFNLELAEGIHLARQNNTALAIPKLLAGLAKSPNSPEGWASLARMYAAQSDQTASLQAARKAVELDENNVHLQASLSQSLAQAGEFEDAVIAAQRAVDLNPVNHHFYGNLGNILGQAGKLEEAEEAYRNGLKIMPNNGDLYGAIGNVLSRSGRLDEAVPMAIRSTELSPENEHGFGLLGHVLSQLGRLEEAADALRRATTLAPDNIGLLKAMFNVRLRLGQATEAIATARKILVLDPADTSIAAELTNLLASHGGAEELAAPDEPSDLRLPPEPVSGNIGTELAERLNRIESKIDEIHAALAQYARA